VPDRIAAFLSRHASTAHRILRCPSHEVAHHLVLTPIEACWANTIETQFGVPHPAIVASSDDRRHGVRRRRTYRFIRLC
jgi:hypothetical protein